MKVNESSDKDPIPIYSEPALSPSIEKKVSKIKRLTEELHARIEKYIILRETRNNRK